MSNLALILAQFLVVTLISASTGEPYCQPFTDAAECPADRDELWTYRGLKGPMYWGRTYPQCNGRNQSPVAIQDRNTVFDPNLPKLAFNGYNTPIRSATIENNGHFVQVRPTDDVARTISVRGTIYALDQINFHLGCLLAGGSEHTINGQRYDMEILLIHVNAAGQYAAVGIFLTEGGSPNAALQPIVNRLSQVRYKGDQTVLSSPLNLNNLLPANPATFYRYEGSMTTPPCTEGVTWSVVPGPLYVGYSQMDEFRSLFSTTIRNAARDCRVHPNFRPLQPLNGRRVFRSQ